MVNRETIPVGSLSHTSVGDAHDFRAPSDFRKTLKPGPKGRELSAIMSTTIEET